MAAVVRSAVALGLAALGLGGCDDLVGLEPQPETPLASIHVRVTGELDPGEQSLAMRVDLAWLRPSLPDPACLPPAENPEHAAVMAAGCIDPLVVAPDFGFSDGSAEVGADRTATIDLFKLPESIYGDITAQIAFAAIVVDVQTNQDRPEIREHRGASFHSMTRPDTRLAFRHGGFDDRLAFYPRRGCGAPPPGFSLLSAGGFSVEAARDAQARGELPLEDPASCREDALDRTVEVALEPAEAMQDLNCFYFFGQASPPRDAIGDGDLTACISLRDRANGRPSGRHQALVAEPDAPRCRSVQHYVLRGCYDDPLCATPDWDVPAPPWWPCPDEAAP